MRKCNKCLEEKDLVDFPKKGGKCKKCLAEYKREYAIINKEKIQEKRREYYVENKESIINKVSKYAEENKEKLKLYKKEYNEENYDPNYHREYREKNKELISIKRKKYYQKNKENVKQKVRDYISENREFVNQRKKENRDKNKDFHNERNREYIKSRKENDPLYRLICSIRTLITQSFKGQFTKKSKKTLQILGCSFEEFKIHIESLFTDEMDWGNYATYWQLDHKIPISWSKTEEDVYKLNHYTNFQPLYWKDNISKGNRRSD